MRLISFTAEGRDSFGIVVGDKIVDVGARVGAEFRGVRHVLEAGALNLLRGMEGLAADYELTDVRFLPVIPDRSAKFLCVGVNYMPHIREMGRRRPDHPVIFVRFAESLIGHLEPIRRPLESEQLDYEGELAVVIGQRARRVPRERALDHVAGYACFNDGSVRDFQRHGPQWTAGKNFHASGAFGPWLVTRDECPDPTRLHLRTRLNGETVQDESVAELCFDVPALIAYCSTFARLEPGDVIATGTPGGVGAGREPPRWLTPGDVVEVDIDGVGTLRNPIVDDPEG